MNNLTKLEINNLKIDTIIGIHDHEKSEKQSLIFDIIIFYNSSTTIKSDNIKDAIDYYDLTLNLKEFISNNHYELLETLSHKILEEIVKDKRIGKAILTISKPKALEDFGAMVKVTNEYQKLS
jgi:7,8-dihydroneopterin aldolase/epimerase/oxygenase